MRRPIANLLVPFVLLVAACGGDSPGGDTERAVTPTEATVVDAVPTSEAPSTTAGTDDAEEQADLATDPVDLSEFCVVAAPLMVPTERAYVGSVQHVSDLLGLLAVAPDDIVDDLTAVRDHFRDDVDPAHEASQDFENFSPAAQHATTSVQGYIQANC